MDALTNLLNDLNDLLENYGYDMAAWSTCEHDPGQLKNSFDLSIFCDKKEAQE